MMTVATIIHGYQVNISVWEAAVCLASRNVATRMILTLLPLLMEPETCHSISAVCYLLLMRMDVAKWLILRLHMFIATSDHRHRLTKTLSLNTQAHRSGQTSFKN